MGKNQSYSHRTNPPEQKHKEPHGAEAGGATASHLFRKHTPIEFPSHEDRYDHAAERKHDIACGGVEEVKQSEAKECEVAQAAE